ncbi:hypothetical protein F2Q70_00006179 [Brassica cretica]|uniref:Uncharacterized protein n=1 Tax=Brassica cretica TaxID=69181 RepID=A0A8S9IT32_BRACR|nr:hypothetical protein F2Q70_00006179 [Brassica cretica]
MNGISEVANEAETSMKTATAEIRSLAKGMAMVCDDLRWNFGMQICDWFPPLVNPPPTI